MIYATEVTKEGKQSAGECLKTELYHIQAIMGHKVLSVHESQTEICGTIFQSFIVIADNRDEKEIRNEHRADT